MCGRTACTLNQDDVVKACRFRRRQGDRQQPVWRDAPGGQKYYPSYNVAPGAHTPVLLSSHHYSGEFEGICERIVQPMKWGLVPSWHKGDPYKLAYETNNCRADGMLMRKTYKVPLEKGQRCVILADGFYEWKRNKEGKQPYFIYFPQRSEISDSCRDVKPSIIKETEDLGPDDFLENETEKECKLLQTSVKERGEVNLPDTLIKSEPLNDSNSSSCPLATNHLVKKEESLSTKNASSMHLETDLLAKGNPAIDANRDGDNAEWQGKRLLTMAGVFEICNSPGSPPLYSYSVITVDASPGISSIHDRMPAILTSDEEIDDWLNSAEVPLNKAVKVIRSVECLQMHMVSSEVNNSRNNSSKCMEPYEPKPEKRSGSSVFMKNWLNKGHSEAKKPKQN
ncbi:LOW QUALITY PROTEIN: embryonic stem cell-specific 5-hydroxymethylcytosine-binding protein-like [Pomacea canaliculata]|uniref:LOW QUALITY PROTEIN: embryonic stem cell-specific 5-hydroxymethylcytosine-binding protein-like n=1 Tax=Pomacea canaliculata TaxID=400727 RepID=UPI000D73C907|nr:LOW QUALITY PROTEIN: embryonic stem cell-specific 5-hydroxymethylcytosine-binding protein-like [Pomacea canaliculata]